MQNTANAAVAAELRAQMARHQVTGGELGRRLSRSDMWVSRRTSGKTAMTVAEIHEIAAALGIEPAVLLNAATPAAP